MQALGYKSRIENAIPLGFNFCPLMTLYLTDNTPPEEVAKARSAGIAAFKLYPSGATTNSDSGVTHWRKCLPALEAMEKVILLEEFATLICEKCFVPLSLAPCTNALLG